MSDFSWWAFGNKVANLAVLIGGCGYLAKKYLVPYVLEELAHRKKELSDLDARSLQLIQERQETLEATAAKEAYAQLLLAKIEQWKEVMNSKEALYDSERKQQDSKCSVYLKMRADGLCHELLKKQVFPVVIAQTREQVLSFFKDAQRQKEYQDALLKGLLKMTSSGVFSNAKSTGNSATLEGKK